MTSTWRSKYDTRNVPVRGSASARLLPLFALLSACAAAPPPRPAKSAEQHVAHANPSPTPTPPPPPRTPSRILEEGDIGEGSDFTPEPEAVAAVPKPTPEQAAAVGPSEAEASVLRAESESLLSHIAPTTPPNVAAALRLVEEGRELMNHGSHDQALDRFERAVAIDPSNAYGYYFLAQLHYRNRNYDQAIAFAGRAAVLSARTDRVWLARAYGLQGAVFEDVGRYADARKAYEKAVEADPKNLAARVGVGRLSAGQ